MSFGDSYYDNEQARRFRNRSILLFIILATLPCYVVGGILLGVAPNDEDVVSEQRTVPAPLQSTSQIVPGETSTGTQTVTATLNVSPTPSQTLPPTPRQFLTPTRFPTQIARTNTPAPSLTLAPSSTVTTTATQTRTPTATSTRQNNAPVFDVAAGQIALEIGNSRTIRASDPDGDSLSLTAVSSDTNVASISFVESGFVINANAIGTATITATATDTQQQQSQVIYTVIVAGSNRNPVFLQAPDSLTLEVGQSTNVTLSVNDPDGDVVVYNIGLNQVGIVQVSGVDDGDYQFVVTGQSAGNVTLTITLSDNNGGTASRQIPITVNEAVASNTAPVINSVSPNPLALTLGDSNTVTVQASDADNDTLTITPQNNNPSLISITPIDNIRFTIQALAAGNATVTIQVSDGTESVSATLNVSVTAANQAPQFNPQPVESLELGVTVTEDVEVFYTDPDGNPVTLTVTSLNTSVATVTKLDNYNFRITALSAGTTQIRIRLNDGMGGVTEDLMNISVIS